VFFQKKKNKNKGFSLFEILIATVVLSLLVLTAVLNIPAQMLRLRDTSRKTDLHKIKNALISFNLIKGIYPDSLPSCQADFTLGTNLLLLSFPCDPKTKSPYLYQHGDDWFKLYANLEKTDDPVISSLGCDNGCGPDCAYNYGTSSTNVFIDRCTPPDIIFACSPGGGQLGNCEQYDDPQKSLCPKTYLNDPTCQQDCDQPQNRCKNNSGKHVPQ